MRASSAAGDFHLRHHLLTGTVPDGCTLGTTTHTVTILDDDTAVNFTQATLDIEEPDMTENYEGNFGVRVTTTSAAAVTVTYEVPTDFTCLPSCLVPSGAMAATTTSGMGQDIEFPTSKTFTFYTTDMGSDLTKALADVSIKADTAYEPDEYVVLEIQDHTSFKDGMNNFNLGNKYLVIKIPENDISMVGFVDTTASSLAFVESTTPRYVSALAASIRGKRRVSGSVSPCHLSTPKNIISEPTGIGN